MQSYHFSDNCLREFTRKVRLCPLRVASGTRFHHLKCRAYCQCLEFSVTQLGISSHPNTGSAYVQ